MFQRLNESVYVKLLEQGPAHNMLMLDILNYFKLRYFK